MIQRQTLLVTTEVNTTRWQLELPLNATLTLVGWRVSPEVDRDGAVPDVVSAMFSRAFAATKVVAFPSSVVAGGTVDASVARVHATDLRSRAKLMLLRAPRSINIVFTRRAETVALAFDDPGFPWSLQGQILFLSDSQSTGPDFSLEGVLAMIEPSYRFEGSVLNAMGLDAVLRPGVDGAVAGLFSRTPQVELCLLSALQCEADREQFEWRIGSEQEFADALAEPWIL